MDLWILFKAVITRDMNLLCILIKGIGSQRIPSFQKKGVGETNMLQQIFMKIGGSVL